MSYTGKTIDLSKYDKYGKNVELSKVEVNLNVINAIKSNLSEAVNLYDSGIKEIREVSGGRLRNAVTSLNKVIDESTKVINVAKDLGLDSKEIEGYLSTAKRILKESESIISKLKSI